jgi:hypothetical protein
MLRLTSIAPDIIEAILCGDEPDGLSLEKPRRNLPVRWDEQRNVQVPRLIPDRQVLCRSGRGLKDRHGLANAR